MKNIAAGMMLIMLAACASRPETAAAIAGPAGLRGEIIATPSFDLMTYSRPGGASESLTLYVEGDGHAWITPTRPSDDPTPRDPVALRLAATDRQGAVAWLARPCQYVGGRRGRGCSVPAWTDARFASEVVEAMSIAVDTLKARSGAKRLRLIGHSGGGTIAALLAARRSDVDLLVTVAAILDVEAWTTEEGLTPLFRSLDPAREVGRLAGIRQIHFVGASDKVVPPTSTRRFAARFGSGHAAPVVELAGFDHDCCWSSSWPSLLIRADREARLP